MFTIKITDLARQLNAKLLGDNNIIIHGITSIYNTKKHYITFLANNKLRFLLSNCKASAIIIDKSNVSFCKITSLVVDNPYLAYVLFAKKLYNIIHNNIIDNAKEKDVTLGKNVNISNNVVIEKNVKLGNNVFIGSNCFIGKNVNIKDNTKLFNNVTIHYDTIIGSNCVIQSGTVIGSDGFGYIKDKKKWLKVPHLGKVIIKNYVEIGSCTTIDRGTLDDTIISDGVIIDNQCQIAHNVTIGKYTAIAGGVIIAGSSHIGNNCLIGGATVINGHIHICDKVTITGMSMVIRSIKKSGVYSSGIPVQQNNKWRKTTVLTMNINKINERIKIIEKNISK
ncbi:MAG: UDP-3-O-(3-hydroxymyristoyl)glucosamine N-acyltransferase [Candidatus Lightella neohaematopini]|nr:UDP-3-O-(3-hydroxymyristoyl)glucosamine N-acyltransferase [Candidatus Lightella neohaematopini]MCV2528947.1 UDP-3-O-(3-hydroxymyristoyl)glucosamine N-acyltransferase [Candidatus Lightella neohaematopini]